MAKSPKNIRETSTDSSDDEIHSEGIMEKLLESTFINASECMAWEVKYYLHLNYKSYVLKREITEIDFTDLIGESLKFCYPDYLSRFVKKYKIYTELDDASMKIWLVKMFRDDQKILEWMIDSFKLDYSSCEKSAVHEFSETLLELEESKERLGQLAHRLHDSLVFLRTDREERMKMKAKRSLDESHDGNKKHECIKSAFYEILRFLGINVMYNGEGELDFHQQLHDCKTHYFKVKPDTMGFLYENGIGTDEISRRKIFLIVEVLGNSDSPIMDKSSISKSDQVRTSDAPELAHNLASRKMNQKQHDKAIIRELRNRIVACGPTACNTGSACMKLYGHLALQLYGAWIRNKSTFGNCMKDTIVGLFVINELIYLAKISDDGSLTYAKNLWFNLNKKNDRFALMGFLYHLKKINK